MKIRPSVPKKTHENSTWMCLEIKTKRKETEKRKVELPKQKEKVGVLTWVQFKENKFLNPMEMEMASALRLHIKLDNQRQHVILWNHYNGNIPITFDVLNFNLNESKHSFGPSIFKIKYSLVS